jgi:hypothetical protein
MFSWITVSDVTPSGLRLSRAWHVKQFLIMTFPIVLTILVTESVFGTKSRQIIQQRRIFYEKMKDKVSSINTVSECRL